jgi:hypothetical protein
MIRMGGGSASGRAGRPGRVDKTDEEVIDKRSMRRGLKIRVS